MAPQPHRSERPGGAGSLLWIAPRRNVFKTFRAVLVRSAKRAAPSRVSPESIVALPSANSCASAASSRQAGGLVGGATIAEHAARRKGGDLAGERLGGGPRLAHRDDAIGEADSLGLTGVYRAAGEDQVECPAHPDQARQPDVAAVDQRHAPAATEDAEDRVLLDDAQVAPERQLEAAGHRIAGDGGDHRLGQQHPARPHGPVAVAGRPGGRASVPMAFRSAPAQNVPPAPHSTATRARRRPRTRGRPPPARAAVGPSTALRASGRSRTTVVTGPARSTRTLTTRRDQRARRRRAASARICCMACVSWSE